MIQLLFIAALLVLMWVLLIQPQRRRQQQQQRMLAELATGEEVVTVGGIYGRVQSIEDDSVQLEIAPQTTIRVTKAALATRVQQEAPEDPEQRQ